MNFLALLFYFFSHYFINFNVRVNHKIFYKFTSVNLFEYYSKYVNLVLHYDFFFLKTINIFFKKIYHFKSNYRAGLPIFSKNWYCGIIYIFQHIRIWLPALILILIFVYFSLVIRNFPFCKIVIEWFLIAMLFYWLISGFVFFGKKYKFGKFTSAIQRFWRRSFIIFWLIESSFFLVFIYLLLNASQEPVFTYDLIQLKKSRLYSWKFFIYKTFFITCIIILSYILMLNIKWNVYSKYSYFIIAITVMLTYVVWVEFYQFFYVLNWYNEIIWIFDTDDKMWYAESIFKRARIVNHYTTICIIAKFWHIVFMYIFWVFFVIRSLESKNINYVFLSSNLQNFLILYIMNVLLMYPWMKFLFRRFLLKPHHSYNELRYNYITTLFNDLFLSYFNNFFLKKSFKRFTKQKFSYNFENSTNFGDYSFSKCFLKNFITRIFYFY